MGWRTRSGGGEGRGRTGWGGRWAGPRQGPASGARGTGPAEDMALAALVLNRCLEPSSALPLGTRSHSMVVGGLAGCPFPERGQAWAPFLPSWKVPGPEAGGGVHGEPRDPRGPKLSAPAPGSSACFPLIAHPGGGAAAHGEGHSFPRAAGTGKVSPCLGEACSCGGRLGPFRARRSVEKLSVP